MSTIEPSPDYSRGYRNGYQAGYMEMLKNISALTEAARNPAPIIIPKGSEMVGMSDLDTDQKKDDDPRDKQWFDFRGY